MFEKIRPKKVYIEIVEQIQELIRQERLKPGDKLPPERALAQKLGVSRPPLREAVSALEVLGLVETRGGKGRFIADSFGPGALSRVLRKSGKDENPFEFLEARRIVEGEIAALAAERASPGDVKKVEDTLDSLTQNMNDVPKAMNLDMQFHLEIAKAAHNGTLLNIVVEFANRLKERMWLNLTKEKTWGIPHRAKRLLEEHKELLEAIKTGDNETARRVVHSHFTRVQQHMFKE